MKITGLNHITINVVDLETSVTFLRKKFLVYSRVDLSIWEIIP